MQESVADRVRDLRAADPGTRRRAAEDLCRLGNGARGAAVALVLASADPDEQVRQWAAAALEELGPPLARDLGSLGERLRDEHADVAFWSATLLGRLGSQAARAVPQLALALTEHDSPQVRQRAAWALGMIGPAAQAAEAALRAAAGSRDARLARLAAQALRQLGCP